MRLVFVLALAIPATAQPPLFADDAPLEAVLTFDRGRVTGDRSDSPPWYPARLSGDEFDLEVGVRTRGFFRLHHLDCDVPPLRLNVRRRAAGGTPFEGQDKLKLVTHCDDRDRDAEQRVLLEEHVYRAYQTLTDASFRTRLVRLTYRDLEDDGDGLTRWAFLIEDDDALAARVMGEVVDREGIHPDATDRHPVATLSVFHWLVGNTDWTVSTLHNTRIVYRHDVAMAIARGDTRAGASPLVAVPYDFDWSGVVDAPYAEPDAQLRIRSVRDRKFLGFCRPALEADAAVRAVSSRRAEILSVFAGSPHLDADTAEDAVDYLEDGFDEIARRGAEHVFDDCLGG